jgi:hypothetical protein
VIRAGVLVIALAAAACAGGIDPVSTATGALGSGSGSGSGEDMPPPDPCANEFPWTMCTADLNTWQKAPYVDSCWIGAPKLLPVHTTMEVVVTCYDYTPRVDGNECKWDEKQWELGRRENTNHGTSTQTVCDHGPRIGQKVLIQTGSTGMMTDPMGGLALLGSLDCTCDGFNTFMGADSLDPASKLVGEVVAALRNTSCDLTNMTAADLAAAAVSMLWNGDFSPLWQCAANAVNQIRNRFHACNNDAATEQAAFWRGGSCPPADQLPGLCQGPRWYF